jgi:ribonuclease I
MHMTRLGAGPSSQWEKHGTCTGLARSKYFAEEERLTDSDELGGARELL